jgi:hypothetical protein
MTPKERQLATIRHKIPDRISVDAIHINSEKAIAHFLKIDQNDVLDRLGIDGRTVYPPFTKEFLKERDGETVTEWGTPKSGEYGSMREYPLRNVHSLSAIERYPWLTPDKFDYTAAAKIAKELDGHYAVRGPSWKPLLCQVFDLMGMEETMMAMMTEPLMFEAVLENVFVFTYQ